MAGASSLCCSCILITRRTLSVRCCSQLRLHENGQRHRARDSISVNGFLSLRASQERLPLYLGFLEFLHNVRRRGKTLLGSLIELPVAPRNPG
jgi:hypothetical protein